MHRSLCIHPETCFTRRQRILLISLIGLAFLLRLYQLNEQSLWFDEALSVLFASLPLHDSLESMLQEGLHHSPLFYILLRPFAAEAFEEFGHRFLPAMLGVLAIPLFAQLGRIVVDARTGILSAALLMINPFHVWYSQETRMYTLLILSALGSMFFFVQASRSPHLRNWLGMTLFTAIGINTHHFAFFIPLVQLIFLIVTLNRNYRLIRYWAGMQFLAGLSLIPWTLVILDWGKFYLGTAAYQAATGLDLLETFWNFSIGYTVRITPFVTITLGLFLLLVILAAKAIYRTDSGLLIVLWAAIPPLLTFLLSFRLPMYIDRYISLSLPPFLLLIGAGVGSIRPRIVRLAATTAVFGAMSVGLYRLYYDANVYFRADWRSVSAYLEESAGSEDIIATMQYQDLVPFLHYYHGPALIKPIIVFDQLNFPEPPVVPTDSKRLWFIIPYPNSTTHLVGHCQAFDMEMYPTLIQEWRADYQDRLIGVEQFPCIRVEVYQWTMGPGHKSDG
jgi:mannosyltransferase